MTKARVKESAADMGTGCGLGGCDVASFSAMYLDTSGCINVSRYIRRTHLHSAGGLARYFSVDNLCKCCSPRCRAVECVCVCVSVFVIRVMSSGSPSVSHCRIYVHAYVDAFVCTCTLAPPFCHEHTYICSVHACGDTSASKHLHACLCACFCTHTESQAK